MAVVLAVDGRRRCQSDDHIQKERLRRRQCSVAHVFEDFPEPRQSMIWGRLISGCGRVSDALSVDCRMVCSVDRAPPRLLGMAIQCQATVLKRHCVFGVWPFDIPLGRRAPSYTAASAEQGARANAGICHAACDLRYIEMRNRNPAPNAARGAPAPGVAHL